jgi:membrane protein
MFKWLPDAAITWRDVWLGAAFTALLFEIGKFLIGLYIGKQGLESTYGAAASLVVLLIWVYYSSQIVLMGAEFTRAYALRHGSRRDEASAGPPPDKGKSVRRSTPPEPSHDPVDNIKSAMRQSPYAAVLVAICTGWLLGRKRSSV